MAQPANLKWSRLSAIVRMPAIIFLVAVFINYPWELAQAPLYAGFDNLSTAWWHCFVASLGDGVLVLLIFAIGALVSRKQTWFERPGAKGYVLMLMSGAFIGILVEWIAVHVAQRWAYAASMPLVPGLAIGVVPVMQMLVLPPLIFYVAAIWTRHRPRG